MRICNLDTMYTVKKELESMNTEITAIIPAYNAARYLEKAVQSVLCQTVPCQIIIVDDASKDETYEVAERYASLYPEQVSAVKNEINSGVAVSRNMAVGLAKTEYIAFLDADDWWETDKLELQLAAIRQSGADACYSGRELMRADGSSTGKILRIPETISYQKLLKGNVISCSSVVMRRQDALWYPMEHDELHEDYILWLSMLRDGKSFVGVNEPLLKSRLGEEGKSRDKRKSARMTYGVYRHMGIPTWKALYYFCCYAWNGVRKYAGTKSSEDTK